MEGETKMMEYDFGTAGWILDHCTTEPISVLQNQETILIAVVLVALGLYFALIYFVIKHDDMKKFLKEYKLVSRFVDWNEARK